MYTPQPNQRSRAGLQVLISPFDKLRAGSAGLILQSVTFHARAFKDRFFLNPLQPDESAALIQSMRAAHYPDSTLLLNQLLRVAGEATKPTLLFSGRLQRTVVCRRRCSLASAISLMSPTREFWGQQVAQPPSRSAVQVPTWVFRARLMRRRHTHSPRSRSFGGIGMLSTHLLRSTSPVSRLNL